MMKIMKNGTLEAAPPPTTVKRGASKPLNKVVMKQEYYLTPDGMDFYSKEAFISNVEGTRCLFGKGNVLVIVELGTGHLNFLGHTRRDLKFVDDIIHCQRLMGYISTEKLPSPFEDFEDANDAPSLNQDVFKRLPTI